MPDNRKFIVELTMEEIKEIVFCNELSQSTRENFFMAIAQNTAKQQTGIQIFTDNDMNVCISHDDHNKIKDLIVSGDWILAVKYLRNITNWGLKDSKDAIDIYSGRNYWPYYKDYIKR